MLSAILKSSITGFPTCKKMISFVSSSTYQDEINYLHSCEAESANNLMNGLRSDTMYSVTNVQESSLPHILAIRVWKFNFKESLSNKTRLIFSFLKSSPVDC